MLGRMNTRLLMHSELEQAGRCKAAAFHKQKSGVQGITQKQLSLALKLEDIKHEVRLDAHPFIHPPLNEAGWLNHLLKESNATAGPEHMPARTPSVHLQSQAQNNVGMQDAKTCQTLRLVVVLCSAFEGLAKAQRMDASAQRQLAVRTAVQLSYSPESTWLF